MSNHRPLCGCSSLHQTKLVVLTGGPGAGKTAVLETVSREFCRHVGVLPEAASILFRGGFPRHATALGRAAAQRAIYRVQRELEALSLEDSSLAVALCDRGTLDGLAYWPHSMAQFEEELGTTVEHELARYSAVIHLRCPALSQGYNHQNPVRTETADEAAEIDVRIAHVWAAHPNVHTVDSSPNFLKKLADALTLIRAQVPSCCAPLREDQSRS